MVSTLILFWQDLGLAKLCLPCAAVACTVLCSHPQKRDQVFGSLDGETMLCGHSSNGTIPPEFWTEELTELACIAVQYILSQWVLPVLSEWNEVSLMMSSTAFQTNFTTVLIWRTSFRRWHSILASFSCRLVSLHFV